MSDWMYILLVVVVVGLWIGFTIAEWLIKFMERGSHSVAYTPLPMPEVKPPREYYEHTYTLPVSCWNSETNKIEMPANNHKSNKDDFMVVMGAEKGRGVNEDKYEYMMRVRDDIREGQISYSDGVPRKKLSRIQELCAQIKKNKIETRADNL